MRGKVFWWNGNLAKAYVSFNTRRRMVYHVSHGIGIMICRINSFAIILLQTKRAGPCLRYIS